MNFYALYTNSVAVIQILCIVTMACYYPYQSNLPIHSSHMSSTKKEGDHESFQTFPLVHRRQFKHLELQRCQQQESSIHVFYYTKLPPKVN